MLLIAYYEYLTLFTYVGAVKYIYIFSNTRELNIFVQKVFYVD